MNPVADLKDTLLTMLESAFQGNDVTVNQQLGVNISNAVKKDGVVIIQNQNVEVYSRIIPSMTKALRLCDVLEEYAQPSQLLPLPIIKDVDPVQDCCKWLFDKRIGWIEMQDFMREKYLEYVINQFDTKSAAAKWLGVGSTYLSKLTKVEKEKEQ